MAAKRPRTAPAAAKPDIAPAAAPALTYYRARGDCRVGHLRREGEVFAWPAFEECPDYLEELEGEDLPEADDEDAEEKDDAAQATAQGATLADLGFGPVQNVEDVTSADMINQ